jgi:hypothetical protein
MRIVQIGAALQRLCPDLAAGQPLAGYFRIKRPRIAATFDAIRHNPARCSSSNTWAGR